MIEDHAEQLTRGLVTDLQSNARTETYHKLPAHELHRRAYEVYHNLGDWLGNTTQGSVESRYRALGRRRCEEGSPLSEVVYALILTKYHLRDYINSSGLVDSAVEMYQEKELHRLVGQFFDKAIYFTTQGYEDQLADSTPVPVMARAR